MKQQTKNTKCIVSFSSKGREDYNHKLLGLLDSCLEFWDGDYLIYSPDHLLTNYKGIKINKGYPNPVGIESFTHEEMPYQFKYALIQEAIELGYEQIIWLDTSLKLVKNPTELFDTVTTFHNLGHDLIKYISDDALFKLEKHPEDIYGIPQIWGGALLFDFSKEETRETWELIKEYSVNGSFQDGGSYRGEFVAHRHDQAVLSVLLHGRSKMLDYGFIKLRQHYLSGEYGNNCYIIYG